MQLPLTRGSGDGVTLTEFLKIIGNRKAFIFLVVFLAILATVAVTNFQPKWYKATTVIRVEKPESDQKIFTQTSASTFDPYFIKEQFEIIQSKLILLDVIRDDAVGPRLKTHLEKKFGVALSEDDTHYYLVDEMLDVENLAGTSIINIGVEVEEDPPLARTLSIKIAEHYRDNRLNRTTRRQDETLKKLEERVAEHEQTVASLRDKVEELREKYRITEDSAAIPTGNSISREMLVNLERVKVSLGVQSIAYKTRWERFKATPEDERISLVNSETVPDQNIQHIHQAYLVQRQNYEQFKSRYGENHPDFIAASQILKETKNQLDQLLAGWLKSLETSYREEEAKLALLDEQIAAAQEKLISSKVEGHREWDTAVKQLDVAERTYTVLKLRYEERLTDYEIPIETVEILNEAVVPNRHSKPKMVFNVALALVGGLVIGVGCAFLIEYFDTSFRSVDDLERTLGLPILGVVSKKEVLVDQENFNTFDTEAYRVIQTNLDLASRNDGSRVFAVQSAGPGEGKSTTLHNIAAIMALVGQRVLVIDSDVRRPSQHKLFGATNKPGLIDFLTGAMELDQVVRRSSVPNLDFIPSGSAQGSHFSLSMLHNQKLRDLLAQVSGSYDKILMDSPPVIGISDSYVIASLVDAVLFVVQHKRNPQSMSIRAKHIIENVDGKVLGVVLNQVPTGGNEDYNYYTSNYYYYGGSDQKPDRSSSPRSKKKSRGKDSARVIENDLESFSMEESEPEAENLPKV